MAELKSLDMKDCEGVLAAFGGVRPLATALGVPASTVQGWKERGAIPKSRHKEIAAAFTQLDQASDIPVAHAIGAAADMKDKVPPEADSETRNYHPPRSAETTATQKGAGAGGANLILSLILLALLLLCIGLAYFWYQSRQSIQQADFQSLEAKVEALGADMAAVGEGQADAGTILSTLDARLASLLALDEQFVATSASVGQVSSQLGTLADDIDSQAEEQVATFAALSQAQTGLFETLSQDMSGKMDTIVANMDASVTERIESLERAEIAAVEDAQTQAAIAQESEAKAREAEQLARAAEAEARAAEEQMVMTTRSTAQIMQLRLALASNAPFASQFERLADLADTSGNLATARRVLAEYASGPYGAQGMPTRLEIISLIDALVATDLEELEAGSDFGVFAVPALDDLTANQGKLAAAKAAVSSGEFAAAEEHVSALDGQARRENSAALAALQATLASQEAAEVLDLWIAQLANSQI